ncbi:MotA/TolQ/ExbB proton channel family protein, probably associated with flagella [hydrothermal vent metagenome]|uniref:MotA/TolQ/ExbB proton channel family protein, probably associated with flagella n=1 Tax=hydrothermal vent metagenome TaxID=652676 RepID=A0A3B0SFF6_9ZZZZ
MSMDDIEDSNVLDLPRVYLVKMMVFTLLVVILAAVLFPQFKRAFMSNPGLNGMIVLVLLLGLGYAFRMVYRLFREVNWVNHFRVGDPGLEIPYSPNLLAPMEALLANRQGATVLSTTALRSLLDSLASRLDEARDISRYMIGLLVFLGLLGTFWGLLQTVASVGDVIKSLDVGSADSATIFDDLKSGLEAPLAGMGTSFSSSLFGLSGSLILGFLDLQASQAQNRFYNSLEDWLASLTDIEMGEAGQATMPQYLQMDMSGLQDGIERMNATLETALSEPASSNGGSGANLEPGSIDKLADAVHGLVQQMREEQKIVRQWVQAQTEQQNEIKKLLTENISKPSTGNRLRAAIRGAKKPEQGK